MNTKPLIVFIANYKPDKQESMLRVSDLYESIIEEAGYQCKTIRPANRIGKLRHCIPSLEKYLNYIDKYVIFAAELIIYAWKIKNYRKVVYHITDHSNSLYAFLLFNQAKVITCHDIIAISSMLEKIPNLKLS